MPTQTQLKCPSCGAKLRLADPPTADEEVECPKCGTVFTPAGSVAREEAGYAPEPVPVPVPKPPKEKKLKGPKKRRAKVKKTNPYFLAILLGGAIVLLVGLGILFWWLFNKAGKVQEALTYVPVECNHARGINAGQVRKYPGYAAEVDKILTPDIKSVQELASAAGMSADDLSDYVVIARSRKGGTTATVYVFRANKDVDAAKLGAGLGGTAEDQGGKTMYRLKAAAGGNILSGAVVYPATKRAVVVIAAGPRQADMVRGAAAVDKNTPKDDTFWGKIGTTGTKVTAGNIWLLVRNTDDLKHYAGATGDTMAEAFKSMADEMAKTPVFGMWTSYGAGGIRFGFALQASSPERAKDLVKSFEDGPLGKKDDAEIPNGMKKGYSQSGSKEFREFLSNLKFTSSGDFAMILSKMSNAMAQQIAGQINGNTLGVTWDPRTDAYANKK